MNWALWSYSNTGDENFIRGRTVAAMSVEKDITAPHVRWEHKYDYEIPGP